jgi:hypothetical protein
MGGLKLDFDATDVSASIMWSTTDMDGWTCEVPGASRRGRHLRYQYSLERARSGPSGAKTAEGASCSSNLINWQLKKHQFSNGITGSGARSLLSH